jgi:transposase
LSLHAPSRDVMPEQTRQGARTAFPNGQPSMRRRNGLAPISPQATFAAFFSHTGRPAAAPAPLAPSLTAPGWDAAVLSVLRQPLITGQAALLLFETLVTRLREQKFLTAKGRHRPDSAPVLAASQPRPRLACVGETLRPALNVLATAALAGRPSWGPAVWGERDSRRQSSRPV